MSIGAALIGAGGSLLGGLLGGKRENTWRATRDGIYAQANASRGAGEKFGFNPLTLLGVSSAIPGGSGDNYMGQAIADAALIAADGIAKNSAAQKLERAERLNSKLQQEVTNLTIRPKVGGIYDQRVATPTTRQALGVSDGEVPDYDAERNSPFVSDDAYGDVDTLTSTQASVKKDVPAFRFFGHDFYGSGLFSTGEQFENSFGEGPLQWLNSGMLLADAVGNEAYKAGGDYGSRLWKQRLIDGYAADEKKRKAEPKREYWTHPQTGFSAPRVPFGFH